MHKIYRSRTDYKIAGICGGLGEMLKVDSNVIRIAMVFLALLTHIFPVVVTYLIAWVILLEAQDEE
ncbi:MAG: PspC domain-containing protein [Candidatus Marinimicrobia bacterium]|nr:PspC domain-containing protein [Candidatus Neomarinimicrobiota bacterium]